MPNDHSLQQVRAQLRDLIDAAKSGALIPARLPAQLEAIDALLTAEPEAAPFEATAPLDLENVQADNARYISHAIHELRNPMTSIRGYADMLGNPAMGPLTDMQKQFAETIRANARRMEGLLTDVSDMAKLRGGTLRLALKMDMFKNIALMVEKKVQPQAASMGKSVTFNIPDGLPLLTTDGEMLAKAFVKLVENSLRYTGDDAQISVSAAGQDGALVVTVQDNGIGIAPDDMAQLGTVYFRSESAVVRAHKGSGLGIPVAYGIIRLVGGTVSVESTPGVGTTFTVRLPALS